MSAMLSLLSWLSWFLLAMTAGGVLHTNLATAKVTIASNSDAVAAYWHTMLPNTPMPPAILELLASHEGIVDDTGRRNTNNVQSIGKTKEDNNVGSSFLKPRKLGPLTKWGPSVWGSATANDAEKSNYKWGPSVWGSATTNDAEKSNYKWGPSVWGLATSNDAQKSNYKWGPSVWGSATANDVQKSNYKWGPSVWGSTTTNDAQKSNYKWGPSVWGSTTTKDVQKSNYKWGPSVWGSATTKDVQKSNYKWGPSVWGSATTNDVQKSNYKWGPSVWGLATTNDVQNSNYKWGPSVWGASTKGEDQKGNQKDVTLLEMGESHIGQHKHTHGAMSDMVFLEEALKPGSTITCYIQPSSTSGAPLLQRGVADSVPMSTRNFTDILAMFAPTSSNMAADVWSTLDFCEHPQAIKGETKACATSVESAVEFAASVLGVSTYNLRALSSPDVPVEGVMTGRGYKVVAATMVAETGDTVTCHGLKFPFAMFMCHAVNPTRVYSVTLEGPAGGEGPGQRIMEVLSVCHLDTSEFDAAKMPLHVKPGDAPLCHFISRDSILLAPAASGRVAST